MSEPRPSLLDELRRAEQAREHERLRPGAVHRIARTLDTELLRAELPPRRRAFIPMASFAAGAALVLGVFALGDGPRTVERADEADAPAHASWQVGGRNCHATRGAAELVLDGSCRIKTAEPGLTIESRKTTRLRSIDRGVELSHGIALFEVEPVTSGPPWRVEVPGGAIEVMGTRFSVVVSGDRGHVDLLEGSIHFIATDGRVHEVEPGERFRFSASASASGSGANAATRPSAALDPAAASGEDPKLAAGERLSQGVGVALDDDEEGPLAAGERLAALAREARLERAGPWSRGAQRRDSQRLRQLVAEVTEFRAQRRYREAVSLLRGALSERWDRHTREVLSYELGTILSTQLPEHEPACAHWEEHRRQFTDGRYERAIERAQRRLRCP